MSLAGHAFWDCAYDGRDLILAVPRRRGRASSPAPRVHRPLTPLEAGARGSRRALRGDRPDLALQVFPERVGDPGLEPGTSSLSEASRSRQMRVDHVDLPTSSAVWYDAKDESGLRRDGCRFHCASRFRMARRPPTDRLARESFGLHARRCLLIVAASNGTPSEWYPPDRDAVGVEEAHVVPGDGQVEGHLPRSGD